MWRKLTVLTMILVGSLIGTTAVNAHMIQSCSVKQVARQQLVCAYKNAAHANGALRFLRAYPLAGTTQERWELRHEALYLKKYARWHYLKAKERMVPKWPPHHKLWMCIHGGEGAWHDRDSGGNGHYGGLQMHPGWGYGTSYYASDDSQLKQEWAAENGYRASGYSHGWLQGQWAATIGPCWEYA